jgi:hypothetical protein
LQSTPSSAQILQAVAPSLVELLDGPWPALSIVARLPDSASIHSWFEQAIVCVIRRHNRIVVELYIQLTPVAKHSFIGPDSAGSGAFLGGAA